MTISGVQLVSTGAWGYIVTPAVARTVGVVGLMFGGCLGGTGSPHIACGTSCTTGSIAQVVMSSGLAVQPVGCTVHGSPVAMQPSMSETVSLFNCKMLIVWVDW